MCKCGSPSLFFFVYIYGAHEGAKKELHHSPQVSSVKYCYLGVYRRKDWSLNSANREKH